MGKLTHVDENGAVRMVDVSEKKETLRMAVARAHVCMQEETLLAILANGISKGNVLETARIAGVMAAKNTASLIPMCHPLRLTRVDVDFFPDRDNHAITIAAKVFAKDRTGVEMEALSAVSIAALTIYDMCKSMDREMEITSIRLMEKTGGKSGTFIRKP